MLHGALVLLILWDWRYWLLALLVMVFHGLIDIIKLYAQKETNKPGWFLTDQALHLVSIIVLWIIWFIPSVNLNTWFDSTVIWIYATALLFLTAVTGIIVQILMSTW